MRALIRQSMGGDDIIKLKTTIESLQKHGFRVVSFKSEGDIDLEIGCGETISSLRNDSNVVYDFGGFRILHFLGSNKGANIIPNGDMPQPEILQMLKSGDEEELTKLVKEHPEAFEPHYQLGVFYLKKNLFDKSFQHFDLAREYKDHIDLSRGYVKNWRDYGLDYNQGLCAYYTGEMNLGRLYVDRLIMNRGIDQALVAQSYINYEFYAQPLKVVWNKEYIVSEFDVTEDIKAYKSLNPSLLRKSTDEIYLNIRIVNWKVNPIGFNQYFSPHPKNKFKTKNLLGVINEDGEFVVKPRLVRKGDDFDLGKIRGHHIDGFEDCRLFHHKDGIIYFITNYTKNNPKGPMKLSIGQIESQIEDSVDLHGSVAPKYVKLTPLQGYGDHLTQKNWLIYKVEGGYAYAIYGYDPLVVVKINTNTGIVTPISEAKLPIRSGEFRGSGGPVPFESGYLIVIHQVYFKEHGGRRYLHRFLYLDSDMIPVGFSEMWYLQSKDIEYVSTMLDMGENVLIGYGMCDRCACISLVSKETIRKMIHPVEEYL